MALRANISGISRIVLVAVGIITASINQSLASEPIPTRTELCGKLQLQTQHAISEHAEAKRAAKAKALQKQATQFCAANKQAQGIRAYAQALKLLGVQPITE